MSIPRPRMHWVATADTSSGRGAAATGVTNVSGSAKPTRAIPSRLYETVLMNLSLRDSHPEPTIDAASSPPTAARQAFNAPRALYYLPVPSETPLSSLESRAAVGADFSAGPSA